MTPLARTPRQRKQDTLDRLERDVDAWVASADPVSGTPYLVPLSFLWDGTTLLVATPAARPAPPTPMIDTFFLVKSFVTLLVITDPLGTVPIFLAITADWPASERNRAAWQAVAVAALVIAAFALFGQQILTYLGISVPSLQVAGGLLLLGIALG